MIEAIMRRVKTELSYTLSQLFPVQLPKIKLVKGQLPGTQWDAFAEPVTECGVLRRAYDVRRTGIERVKQEGL